MQHAVRSAANTTHKQRHTHSRTFDAFVMALALNIMVLSWPPLLKAASNISPISLSCCTCVGCVVLCCVGMVGRQGRVSGWGDLCSVSVPSWMRAQLEYVRVLAMSLSMCLCVRVIQFAGSR